MKYYEAVAIAEAYDKNLRADDPRFRRSVMFRVDDGATFFLPSAFLMQIEAPDVTYVVCFSEHHKMYVYDAGDLIDYVELTRIDRSLELLK